MKTYRLPGGDTTTDPDAYLAAWNAIGNRVENLLGWKTLGFDPDFLFEATPRLTVTLPLFAVEQILAKVEQVAANTRDDCVRRIESSQTLPQGDYYRKAFAEMLQDVGTKP
jgi:hypothetical protein